MPPKKHKGVEPTDRATRSRNTEKPAPKYTYSSEEESFEENFNPNIDLTSTGNLPRLPAHLLPPVVRRSYSPTEFDSPTRSPDKTTHRTLFHSIQEDTFNMSDNESDHEGGARIPPPAAPIIIPGLTPEMQLAMAMMQQTMANNQQLAMQQQAAQTKALMEQMERKERQAERNRKQDQEQNQAAMRLLIDQMANINRDRPEKPKSSAVKNECAKL